MKECVENTFLTLLSTFLVDRRKIRTYCLVGRAQGRFGASYKKLQAALFGVSYNVVDALKNCFSQIDKMMSIA